MHPIEPKPSMGIVQLHEGEKKFQLSRYAPSEQLTPFIKHFWIIKWDLTGQAPYFQDVVPNPCVNLVIEAHRSGIYGVASRKYTKKIEGKGIVFGVKFQPGGFYPFIKRSIAELTDQATELHELFGTEADAFEASIRAEEDPLRLVELAERLFLQRLPNQDENIAHINQIIDRIKEHHDMTKVDHICKQFDINQRKLQRLFKQYVGVSPKWVIQLYRLQNAAEALDTSTQRTWQDLCTELGYFDQSHFIKDFKSIIGKTPVEYAAAARASAK